MGNRAGSIEGKFDREHATDTSVASAKPLDPKSQSRDNSAPIRLERSFEPWLMKFLKDIDIFCERMNHRYPREVYLEFSLERSVIAIYGIEKGVKVALIDVYELRDRQLVKKHGTKKGKKQSHTDTADQLINELVNVGPNDVLRKSDKGQEEFLTGNKNLTIPANQFGITRDDLVENKQAVVDKGKYKDKTKLETDESVFPSTSIDISDVDTLTAVAVVDKDKYQDITKLDTDESIFPSTSIDVSDVDTLTAVGDKEKKCLTSQSDDHDTKLECNDEEKVDENHVKTRISTFRNVIKNLTKAELEQLENVEALANINIDKTNGIVTIEGQGNHVSEAKTLLETRIESIRSVRKRDVEARRVYGCVRWNYQSISGDQANVEEYDKLTNLLIETAYKAGESELTLVDVEGVSSMVKFHEMIEYIHNEEHDCVKLTRTQLKPGESSDTMKGNNEATSLSPEQSVGFFQNNTNAANGKVWHPSEEQPAVDNLVTNPSCMLQPKDQRHLKLEDEYIKLTVDADRDLITLLTKQEIKELESVQALANIKIDIANGYITLDGPLRDVRETETRIHTKLRHIHRKRWLKIEYRMPNIIVKWSYDIGGGSNDRADYEESINVALEASFRNFNDAMKFSDNKDKKYVIDFVDMVEYDETNRNDQVAVYRRVLKTQKSDESSDSSTGNGTQG